jgi:hypothetical protein
MAVHARYLEPHVRRDLRRKMVFVAGPRQVGKTTLARRILGRRAGYLNWDADADREAILRGQLPASDFWVFDEIHKYRLWRRLLKGLYDTKRSGQRILVTGSARLDYYRHGGDSSRVATTFCGSIHCRPGSWPCGRSVGCASC